MIQRAESINNRTTQTGIRAGRHRALLAIAFTFALASILYASPDTVPSSFNVKFVSADAVYLDAGSNAGLTEGQKLLIKRKGEEDAVVAQIEIESVASASAVGKILSRSGEIAPGDVASLTPEELSKMARTAAGANAAKYPQVITFTQDDPLDQELRENLPRPALPEINRMRGRMGFDFGYMQSQGGFTSSLYGVTMQLDASRLAGSYWNLRGYYRGYRHSSGGNSQMPMIVDLVNRTYHLSLTYDNPNSRWVAGVGRMLLPWASSLDTLDGFYLGRRYGKATTGIFGGSTPDPTSWNYNPDRQMAGGFVNIEGGSYDSFRFTSTAGIALTRINWRPDRQFGFFQNGISYKRYLSVYSDVQVDMVDAPSATGASSPAAGNTQSSGMRDLKLSRGYFTVRLQPFRALSFDVNEIYFRNIPTFDERLLSTGLLDKYLFQGLSGGFRLELPYRFGIYSTVGRSSRSGDEKPSWDYLVGASNSNVLHTGVRVDLRYSKFDSSFGGGTYRSLMLSRDLGERLQFDVQIGQQDFLSTSINGQNRSRFVTGDLNWFLKSRYYLGVGMTWYRGTDQNYRQSFVTLGYRFDNRKQRHE
jgi:hypothetical protein